MSTNTPVTAECKLLIAKSQSDASMGSVISYEISRIFEIVNFGVICGIVGLFGITSNIINIRIFYKQGFTNTVNIAFLGLAISDLCCLLTLGWISTCRNSFFITSGKPWILTDVMYLSGAWPHVCFCRITSYITVYITAERYLCIALPLKIKQIVTAKRTTLIICTIYFVNIATLIPEYTTSYLDWKLIPGKNITVIALLFTNSRESIEGLCFVLHSMLSTTSFLGVIVVTVMLVLKLKKTSEWRKEATSNNNQRQSMSTRERKMVKMIVLISCILIVCYTPGAIVSLFTFIVPEFSIFGRYINMCMAAWSIACSFQVINSSLNIFLYYRMSSKYKHFFDEIFLKPLRMCGI